MPSQFNFTTAAPHIGNNMKQVMAASTDYLMIHDLEGGQQCKSGLWFRRSCRVMYVWVSVIGIMWVLYKVMFGNAYVCACVYTCFEASAVCATQAYFLETGEE
jgi:hypothetical protein